MTVHIVLASFNGEPWLDAQLASLQRQGETDWRLLVADDGSGDATISLLRRYAASDSRIELLPAGAGRLGPCGNFERLLNTLASRPLGAADAVALCDQDDVWAPEKLALQLAALREAMACCSELELTDESGKPSGQQMLRSGRASLQPSLASMLAQNSVVGCTLMLRPQVLELALPFPPGLINHDWWLGVCALALGRIQCLEQPLVAYRQHGSNAVGAYRPWQALRDPLRPLARQRRVLRSQLDALAVLADRLDNDKGSADAAALVTLGDYLHRVGDASGLRRVTALAAGPYAAPFVPLRLLRCLAVLGV